MLYNTNLGTMAGAQEIEQQGLQTLYLMNPAGYPGSYDDTPNILLLNSAAPSSSSSVPPSLLLSHASAPPSTSNSIHHLLGIPLQLPAPPTSDPNHYISSHQAFNSNLNPRLWSSAAPPHQQQGVLSLSLYSPHHTAPPVASASSETGLSSNGVRFWMGSKYLKVAQQLLDEVVSASKCQLRPAKNEKAASVEPTTADQRQQDLHMKNVKLVNMLEEVEQRYKQYHHHIQTLVSSFEAAMGSSGAARTYTALALQTISKHFRCLKDVISAQIRGNAKSLQLGGDEEGSLGEADKSSSSGCSRALRLMDQQLRQKRAFQQIGMVQHNAWRTQRGLPERSVSILRAWLFQHFLHPYPKDSDKQSLAKQTGLTRSQVSNWFINARVRLWKPMVEEMYMEELKGAGGDIIIIGDENSSSSSSSRRRSNTNGAEYSTSNGATHGDQQDLYNFVSPILTKNDEQIAPRALNTAAPHEEECSWDEEECSWQSNQKRVRSSESMHTNMQQHSMIKFGMGLQHDDKDEDRSLQVVVAERPLLISEE